MDFFSALADSAWRLFVLILPFLIILLAIGFILSQLHVKTPDSLETTSVLASMIKWIADFIKNTIKSVL